MPTTTTSLFLGLRDQGYTNKQIAQKTNTPYAKVLGAIGRQPVFMTANSHKMGGAKRHVRAVTIKANKAVFMKSQRYTDLCNEAAETQKKINALFLTLAKAKHEAASLESSFIAATELDTATAIRCPVCGRLIAASTNNRRIYCPTCSANNALHNAAKYQLAKRGISYSAPVVSYAAPTRLM